MKKDSEGKPIIKQLIHHSQITVKKISPEQIMEKFKESGIEVNHQEAEQILEFLYTLTKITLKEFFLSE
ncbi:hypothetical protein ACQWU4_14425 [Chryseobacterium sp. MIQD13]|uniref:hypothetical protein n=1 Tax=Chryseobacterium sp. MIQD13 TaxID=3422310 RepID=UPI003D2690C2